MSKKFLFALLFATRLTRLVAWFNRSQVTILCYHSVTRQSPAEVSDPHKLHINVESFLRHLDYLQAHYRIVALADFVRARQANIKLPARAAILTFEDGIRNFLTVVAPILRERGIPATSFIVTGANFTQESSSLNGHWNPEDDKSFLSWSEIRQLAGQGLEFGSHTCSHSPLPELSPAGARSELEESLNALASHLGSDSFPLSYPHGRTSSELIHLSECLGYSCAVTTELGPNDAECDLFALRRTVIASDDDLPTFAARLSGLTYWHSRIGKLFNARTMETSEPATVCYDQIEEFES
jgi:peptidoglycan/xylan/chitin deacetylase (PgdA/CDA1 family)